MVRAVMQQLVSYGEVRRGRIGLTTQDVTPEQAKSLGAQASQGAVVVEVAKDSPADKAGVRAGDVIVAVNGRAIRGSADVRNQVGLIPVGEEVEFKVLRNGRVLVLKARVEETAIALKRFATSPTATDPTHCPAVRATGSCRSRNGAARR